MGGGSRLALAIRWQGALVRGGKKSKHTPWGFEYMPSGWCGLQPRSHPLMQEKGREGLQESGLGGGGIRIGAWSVFVREMERETEKKGWTETLSRRDLEIAVTSV